VEFQLVVSSEQEAFNGADFGFSIDWNLQIKLFKVNYWMFWLDDLSVEIFLRKDSEKDNNSIIGKLSSKRDFVVSISAVIAQERCQNDFSKERDFGQEEGCGTV